MSDHHFEIEAACEELRACIYADDPQDLVARFRCFEHAVLAHLSVEETAVLPIYARHAPKDAAVIRVTHEDLRRQLFRLGIEVELHAVRAESLERLVQALRAHAAHEDRGMYPWVRAHMPPQTRADVFARMANALRMMAGDRTPATAPAASPVNE